MYLLNSHLINEFKCTAYPFSCSTLPRPLYNQPVQLELDSADLLVKKNKNKTKLNFEGNFSFSPAPLSCVLACTAVGTHLTAGTDGCTEKLARWLLSKSTRNNYRTPGFWLVSKHESRNGRYVWACTFINIPQKPF